ncbi:HdeD family acid-resistance protein [Microbacterium sp. GXF7504]
MTSSPRTADHATRADGGIRIALGIGGIIALIAGALVLFWPAKTAIAVTVLVAVYAVAAGVVYVAIGIWSRTRGGWSRAGNIILGVVFVIAAVIAFSNLRATTLALALVLGIVVGAVWFVEGIVILTTLSGATSKGWRIVSAVISILAGIAMLFAPLWGIEFLAWLLGIALVVIGIVQIVRASTRGAGRPRRRSTAAHG